MARDDCRLGSGAGGVGCAVDRDRKSRCASSIQRPPFAGLLRCRSRRLHVARPDRGGREGFGATLFYTTVYAFTLVGAFGVVALVRRETGGDDFKNFSGLWSRSPLLSGCMAIFMLSLAGLPPLAGFFGKFYLFSAAMRAGADHGLLWLVALALLGSFVSLYYYLAVLKAIFVDESETGIANPSSLGSIHLDFLQRISLVLLAGTVVLLGLLPKILVTQIAVSLPVAGLTGCPDS